MARCQESHSVDGSSRIQTNEEMPLFINLLERGAERMGLGNAWKVKALLAGHNIMSSIFPTPHTS